MAQKWRELCNCRDTAQTLKIDKAFRIGARCEKPYLFVMSNPAAKMGLRRRPNAFTEQGVAMLSSVLHSERAVDVNIEKIVRSAELPRLRRCRADG